MCIASSDMTYTQNDQQTQFRLEMATVISVQTPSGEKFVYTLKLLAKRKGSEILHVYL